MDILISSGRCAPLNSCTPCCCCCCCRGCHCCTGACLYRSRSTSSMFGRRHGASTTSAAGMSHVRASPTILQPLDSRNDRGETAENLRQHAARESALIAGRCWHDGTLTPYACSSSSSGGGSATYRSPAADDVHQQTSPLSCRRGCQLCSRPRFLVVLSH